MKMTSKMTNHTKGFQNRHSLLTLAQGPPARTRGTSGNHKDKGPPEREGVVSKHRSTSWGDERWRPTTAPPFQRWAVQQVHTTMASGKRNCGEVHENTWKVPLCCPHGEYPLEEASLHIPTWVPCNTTQHNNNIIRCTRESENLTQSLRFIVLVSSAAAQWMNKDRKKTFTLTDVPKLLLYNLVDDQHSERHVGLF